MQPLLDLAAHNLDALACFWFASVIVLYRLFTGRRKMVDRSLVGAIQRHRVQWMANMAVRDPRIMDSMLIGNLGQGNAFFASTSAIVIGALAAMLGSGDKVQTLIEKLPMVAKTTPVLWEIKIVLLMVIFVYAFFKYAWAFRLMQYAYIMLGATPIMSDATRDIANRHAMRTARLVGIAAEHANSGLRSFYYAIAAMGWFIHPLAFMLTTTWVVGILIRRDFFSRSLAIISDE